MGSKGTHGFAGDGPNYDVNPVWPIVGLWQPGADARISVVLSSPISHSTWATTTATTLEHLQRVRSEGGEAVFQGLQFISHYTFSHADGYDSNYYAISHPDCLWDRLTSIATMCSCSTRCTSCPSEKARSIMGGVGRGHGLCGGWMAVEQHHQLEQRLALDPQLRRMRYRTGRRRLPSKQGSGSFHTGVGSLRQGRPHHLLVLHPASQHRSRQYQRAVYRSGCRKPWGTLDRNTSTDRPVSTPICRLVKKFPVTERVNAQFRMDAFNVFNHPVYAFSAEQWC